MAGASLHLFYVMTLKIILPEYLDVMADTISHKGRPSKCHFSTRNGLHENDAMNLRLSPPESFLCR